MSFREKERYLDFAGASPVNAELLTAAHEELISLGPYLGNPHSKGPASSRTQRRVDVVRELVLEFCGAPVGGDYCVVFTSGATAALKLVGEGFPWSPASDRLTKEHKGGERKESPGSDQDPAAEQQHLFALSAECNFSGDKADLRHIPAFRARHPPGSTMVLLDAAKACATSPFDLEALAARGIDVDFVAVSFYKVFGYPTGLGALIAKRSSMAKLRKTYFGGGTVDASAADAPWAAARQSPSARFEDGTISFLSILSLRHGLEWAKQRGMAAVDHHTYTLARRLRDRLVRLHHHNGAAVCRVYGWGPGQDGPGTHGSIVAFNLLRAGGECVGYAEVEKLATLHRIQIRSGCFCNPGACQLYLGLTADDVRTSLAEGHVCWDDNDLMSDGRPTGAVRASFGASSDEQDADAFAELVEEFFVESGVPGAGGSRGVERGHDTSLGGALSKASGSHLSAADASATSSYSGTGEVIGEGEGRGESRGGRASDRGANDMGTVSPSTCRLSAIMVYPVKSCGGMRIVSSWPVGPRGLLFDREWAVVDSAGNVLNQKTAEALGAVTATVHLDKGTLELSLTPEWRARLPPRPQRAAGEPAVTDRPSVFMPLEGTGPDSGDDAGSTFRTVRVCGLECRGKAIDCAEDVNSWLSDILGRRSCRLVRACPGERSAPAVAAGRLAPRLGRKTGGRAPANTAVEAKGDAGALSATPRGGDQQDEGQQRVAIGFANEGQYLLVNEASVADLDRRIQAADEDLGGGKSARQVVVNTFRPNLVVSGALPYEEDHWRRLQIGELRFTVTGPCSRCRMVNIDQATGIERAAPLRTLARYRRVGANILFGQFLARIADEKQGESSLQVGASVYVN
eukprot:g1471.t1